MANCRVISYSSPHKNFLSPVGKPHSPISRDYEDINIVRLLSKAKFPVYQAYSPTKKKNFALKVYGFQNEKPHPHFRNEARFDFLKHPNIISIAHIEEETSVNSKGKDKPVSCILMEYAPHGDFFDFVKNNKVGFDDKMTRTYFQQLILGIEYLHQNNVFHLDLKLENLLLGEEFQLKIADFDLSFISGDTKLLTKGTKFYRAPEMKASKCKNGGPADIYAAGIILFVLKSGGVIPHAEDSLYQGINLLELLNTDIEEFFRTHCLIQDKDHTFFEDGFKKLFASMVNPDPDERVTINDIKKSNWFQGPIYTKEELKIKLTSLLKTVH